MFGLRRRIRNLIPRPLRERLDERRFREVNRRVDAEFGGDDAVEVFSNIYKRGVWGREKGTEFYSGGGSHHPQYIDAYDDAVVRILSTLSAKVSVVDLGCGDFNVGSRIRPFCDRYVACDVVAGLIDHNRKKFSDLDVDFRCLNAISDDLPDGDVVFIREVLQHLSNDQITKVVRKLQKYRFVVLTECLPLNPGFVPNTEKKTGPGVRFASGSGVVLTEPPFLLPHVTENHICTVRQSATSIRTTVYQLS
jgi:hypothetical protein